MKIDKITFKNNQAWLVIKSEDGEYLGTWHCVNPDFVKALQQEMPKELFFKENIIEVIKKNLEKWKTGCPKEVEEGIKLFSVELLKSLEEKNVKM